MSFDRVLRKFDELMHNHNFSEAESLLLYWENECTELNDFNGLFQILNELVGYYRKVADSTKGLKAIERLLTFIKNRNIGSDFGTGVAYINIATALSSFSKYNESYSYFLKAKEIFENTHDIYELLDNNTDHKNDDIIKKFASLYNNMATTLLGLNELDNAVYYNKKALDLNKKIQNNDLDSAVTCLNLANVIEKRDGIVVGDAAINELVNDAKEIIEIHKDRTDGYYKYVIEKCLPTFEYYGYFFFANTLKKRVKEMNEKKL